MVVTATVPVVFAAYLQLNVIENGPLFSSGTVCPVSVLLESQRAVALAVTTRSAPTKAPGPRPASRSALAACAAFRADGTVPSLRSRMSLPISELFLTSA